MFDNLYIERYRPKTLDDIILTKEEKNYFLSLKDKKEIPHLLFTGSPGTGKTSLAKILVTDVLNCQYLYINASDENGIDTIRSKVIGFSQTKSFDGGLKVVLFDECDSITFDAQKALRNVIEEYSSNTRFIFTCNYLFKIIPALKSRCQVFEFAPPIDLIVGRVSEILKTEKITVPETEKGKLIELVRKNYPDIRRIINDVQKYSYSGSLLIKEKQITTLTDKIVTSVLTKQNLFSLRKQIIENEVEFSSDYHFLLKEMFECIFNKEIPEDKKTNLLLTISEAMYQDALVVDKEINWFSCCLKLSSY
jgi:DNA polymerase III delta prime subunit